MAAAAGLNSQQSEPRSEQRRALLSETLGLGAKGGHLIDQEHTQVLVKGRIIAAARASPGDGGIGGVMSQGRSTRKFSAD